MKKPVKLVIVAGARPNFMKVAPIIREIRLRSSSAGATGASLTYRLVHTGQHYDANMSELFFRQLGIPEPDLNLGVGSGSHAVQTAEIMKGFEPVLLEHRPDAVLVVGDVNSTIACGLVAVKLGIKLVHVEAGLRSFDRSMPEEINRVLTDAISDLLFCTEPSGVENLRREGVPTSKIRCVGNVMVDSLVANLDTARSSPILNRLGLTRKAFAYVTLHRPSNVDAPADLASVMAELGRVASRMPVVFPMHPRTRKMCALLALPLDGIDGLRIVEPLGYHDSLCLTEAARFVLTDSGGLQEESTYLRTPCLTLRPNTERPITVTIGSNRLTRLDRLSSDIDRVLALPAQFGEIPPLWDGLASGRIIDCLLAAD